MTFDRRKLGIALVLVYIVCTIFTAYLVFNLGESLVTSGAINLDQLSRGESVITALNLSSVITLLIGLAGLLYLLNNRTEEVIYVEKKRNETKATSTQEEEDAQFEDVDIGKIRKIAQSKKANPEKMMQDVLNEICKELEAGLGAFYLSKKDKDLRLLEMTASYALAVGETKRPTYEFGEGLVGQVATGQKLLTIDDVPEGYMKVVSGLGSAEPKYLLIAPVMKKDTLYGVAEIASFTPFNKGIVASIEKAFEVVMGQLTENVSSAVKEKEPAKSSSKKKSTEE